jgi:hypothetical protein
MYLPPNRLVNVEYLVPGDLVYSPFDRRLSMVIANVGVMIPTTIISREERRQITWMQLWPPAGKDDFEVIRTQTFWSYACFHVISGDVKAQTTSV